MGLSSPHPIMISVCANIDSHKSLFHTVYVFLGNLAVAVGFVRLFCQHTSVFGMISLAHVCLREGCKYHTSITVSNTTKFATTSNIVLVTKLCTCDAIILLLAVTMDIMLLGFTGTNRCMMVLQYWWIGDDGRDTIMT